MKLLSTEAEGVNEAIPESLRSKLVNDVGRVGALLGLQAPQSQEKSQGEFALKPNNPYDPPVGVLCSASSASPIFQPASKLLSCSMHLLSLLPVLARARSFISRVVQVPCLPGLRTCR